MWDLFRPVLILGGVALLAAAAISSQRDRLKRQFAKLDVGRFRKLRMSLMSREKLKILYVTYQIICSTAYTLDVHWPYSFTMYLVALDGEFARGNPRTAPRRVSLRARAERLITHHRRRAQSSRSTCSARSRSGA